MRYFLFIIAISLFACKHSSCDNIPKEFKSIEEAIAFIKSTDFKVQESINTSKSSWIGSLRYFSCSGDSGYIIIKMQNKEYIHQGVPKVLWNEFKNTNSFGAFYDENLKGKYMFNLINNGNNEKKDTLFSCQKKLHDIIDSFDSGYVNAPNKTEKKLFEDHPLEYFNKTVRDSIKNMNNFKVKVISISYKKENGKIALTPVFDDGKIIYMGYAKFEGVKEMMEDKTYKFISGFRENSDTVLSFIYLQHVYQVDERLILQVIPLPKEESEHHKQSMDNQLIDLTHWLLPNN